MHSVHSSGTRGAGLRWSFLAVLVAALGSTACSNLIFLNGFAPENLIAQNPSLPGIWSDDENVYTIQSKERGYTITLSPKDKTSPAMNFTARLFRAGKAEVLDLVETGSDDPFRISVHTAVRIWVGEHTLKFAWLDSEWLRAEARKQLATQEFDNRSLVTAPADSVARFVLLHADDDRAYKETDTFTR